MNQHIANTTQHPHCPNCGCRNFSEYFCDNDDGFDRIRDYACGHSARGSGIHTRNTAQCGSHLVDAKTGASPLAVLILAILLGLAAGFIGQTLATWLAS